MSHLTGKAHVTLLRPEGNTWHLMHLQHHSAFKGLPTEPSGKALKKPPGSSFHSGDEGADEKLLEGPRRAWAPSWPWWQQPAAALCQGGLGCARAATQGPWATLRILVSGHKVDGKKPEGTGEKMPPSSSGPGEQGLGNGFSVGVRGQQLPRSREHGRRALGGSGRVTGEN